MIFIAFLIAILSFVHLVASHGNVLSVTLNGKKFAGPHPFSKENPNSPVRKISTTFPITSVDSRDMNCGINAKPAALVAPVKAGSEVTFAWESGIGKRWGHSIGPIMTYMARCQGSCKTFDPTKAKFFKISQIGRKPNSMTWVQADIKAGKTFTTQIPAQIPSGEYLIRHELIALHFATKKNGAQMYPSCIQVNVTGGQGKTLPTETVSFPGGYKATDPGIFTPNIFTKRQYSFPGPSISKNFGAAALNNNHVENTISANTTSTNTTITTPHKAEVHARAIKKHASRSRVMRDLSPEALNHH